jgi:hypothetical protein
MEELFGDIVLDTERVLAAKKFDLKRIRKLFLKIEKIAAEKKEEVGDFFTRISERFKKKTNLEEFFFPIWIDLDEVGTSGRTQKERTVIQKRIINILEGIREEAKLEYGIIIADDFRRMCRIL